MFDTMLYLSRADVKSLGISPREAREAILRAFRDHAGGLNRSLPKSSLMIGPGHGFQSMAAASEADSIASMKWVAMAPTPPNSRVPGINGLIVLNDYATGVPVAVLDGDEITLVRTAALSAAAASLMAPEHPVVMGFVGCGLQAYAHLSAFLDLYPGLKKILAFSRSGSSAEQLAQAARSHGLEAQVVEDHGDLLTQSDIVISMVPGAPGLKPFLNARILKANAFVSAVDLGRSWFPDDLPAFDVLATDSLEQSKAPYDVNGDYVKTVRFDHDLAGLISSGYRLAGESRSLFAFKGFALADLALAHLVHRRAMEAGAGTALPR
ncbi:ornithine cyclodeaminase family protein [Bosea sp. NPDC055332]